MHHRFGFATALILLAMTVGGLSVLATAGSQALAASGKASPAKVAPAALPAVKPGTELVFELPDAVRAVNPRPVRSKEHCLRFGDTCHVEAGRRATVVAVTQEKKPRALLRLRAPRSGSRFNCPADVLFFLPVKAVQQMIKERRERLAREAAEKDTVRRLLKKRNEQNKK